MVTAEELIKKQKERDYRKNITFNKIYEFIESKIVTSSAANNYHTWYQIPEFMVGLPLYSLIDCKDYIIKRLKENKFEIEFYEPNIILIKWFPKCE